MAVLSHIIKYDAKNFDDLVTLLECFVDAVTGSTISSFQAEEINGEWTATISFLGDFVDFLTCEITSVTRLEFIYPAELSGQPPIANYTTWLNGNIVKPNTIVLSESIERVRLTFPNPTFAPGDIVEVSFCNKNGMVVSTVLVNSFVRNEVNNTL